MGQAVDKTVPAHHTCLRAAAAAAVQAPAEAAPVESVPPPAAVAPPPEGTTDVCGREPRLVVRTQERYTAVQQLIADEHSLNQICQQLRLDRGTVRRVARATSIDELMVKAINRTGKPDGYTDHLHARYHSGVTDAITLHAELRQLGFTGSVQTVRRFLQPLRGTSPRPRRRAPARPPVPKPATSPDG